MNLLCNCETSRRFVASSSGQPDTGPLVTEEAQLAKWSQQFSPQLQLQLQQICFPANKKAAVHSDILQTPGLKQADTILLLQSCVTCEEHFQNAVKDYLINLLVSGDINI